MKARPARINLGRDSIEDVGDNIVGEIPLSRNAFSARSLRSQGGNHAYFWKTWASNIGDSFDSLLDRCARYTLGTLLLNITRETDVHTKMALLCILASMFIRCVPNES